MRGTMLWFNRVKDLGCIASETGEQLSVRGSGFVSGARPASRCGGTIVEFRVAPSTEGWAEDVTLVPEVAPRRARRRPGRH